MHVFCPIFLPLLLVESIRTDEIVVQSVVEETSLHEWSSDRRLVGDSVMLLAHGLLSTDAEVLLSSSDEDSLSTDAEVLLSSSDGDSLSTDAEVLLSSSDEDSLSTDAEVLLSSSDEDSLSTDAEVLLSSSDEDSLCGSH